MMLCTVRSAERVVFEGPVERVVARSPYGEFAVMGGHAPLVAVLVPGVVRIQAEGKEHVIVCRGGTVDVTPQHVTLLVERPHTLEEIDVDVLRAQLASDAAQLGPSAEETEFLELLCRVKEQYG